MNRNSESMNPTYMHTPPTPQPAVICSEMDSPAEPELHPAWQMKPVFGGGEWVGGVEREGGLYWIILLFVSAALVIKLFSLMLIKTRTILTIGSERPVKELMGNELPALHSVFSLLVR